MTPALERWQVTAFYAFLVRWREAFKTGASTWPPELRTKLDEFLRLGVEPDVLELDLQLTVDELRMAYETLYAAPEDLARKKFAVVYHTDNFYVRTHKFLENVHGAVRLSAGLAPDLRPAPGTPSPRQTLSNALSRRSLTAIDATLRDFERDHLISQARDARNLFVHRYRDEPKWPALGPASRLLGFEDTDKTALLIRRELDPSQIDRYADRKAGEFDRIRELISSLRARLYRQYLQAAISFLSKEPPEVRERWQWLVGMEEFIRDVENTHEERRQP